MCVWAPPLGYAESTHSLVSPEAARHLRVANATLIVDFIHGGRAHSQQRILTWIRDSAQAVAHYYGRFPVPRLRLTVTLVDGNRVRDGTTFGGASPHIKVVVGVLTSGEMLRRD